MNTHMLDGLRAMNPLGFLAALGVLTVLDRMGPAGTTLAWSDEIDPSAVLHTALDREAVVQAVLDDRDQWQGSPALHFTVDGRPIRDVKLPYDPDAPDDPGGLRAWIAACADASGLARPGVAAPGSDGGRAIGLVSALVAEGSVVDAGEAKPTDLHFTAGRQQLLHMARELRDGLTAEHVEEALFGPWRYDSDLPSFKWDVADDRLYVFASVNPATDAKATVPGAEWLALMGLPLLPVTYAPGRTRTTGCTGTWKAGTFTWPVWEAPLGVREVGVLVGLAELCEERIDRSITRRGVTRAYRSRITRAEQGGYGSFRPPSALLDA